MTRPPDGGNSMDILDIIAITQAAYIAAHNVNGEDKNNE